MRALDAPVLWFAVERTAEAGRACRDYRILDAAGGALADARAFPWRRAIPITDATRAPLVVLTRRRSFPLTGRVDVTEPAGGRLGTVTRSGRYQDAYGHPAGAFRDARSVRARTGEAVLTGLLDLVFGGDATTSLPSEPGGFVWFMGDRPAGTLRREPLPWRADGSAVPAPGRGAALARLVPERLRRRLRTLRGPTGWLLERLPDAPREADPRLTLAAALFAIELSYW